MIETTPAPQPPTSSPTPAANGTAPSAQAFPPSGKEKAAKPTVRQQWNEMMGKYRALPARQRIFVVAVLVVLGYLATDEFSWSLARQWQAQGDRVESALQRSTNVKSNVNADLRRAVAVYGEVRTPQRNDEGGESLSRAIDEVLRKHNVAGSSFATRTPQRLKDPDTSRFGGAGLDRIQAEVKFDAQADELPKILADLEAHPDVTAITTLRLQRGEPAGLRKIGVQATIESWVQASQGRKRT
jgi:hypothetical protein